MLAEAPTEQNLTQPRISRKLIDECTEEWPVERPETTLLNRAHCNLIIHLLKTLDIYV
jgi:hypothetical protein